MTQERRALPAYDDNDPLPDPDSGSWRGPIRLLAGLAMAGAWLLAGFTAWQGDAADLPELVEQTFYAYVVSGIAVGVYIATRADE